MYGGYRQTGDKGVSKLIGVDIIDEAQQAYVLCGSFRKETFKCSL